MHGYGPLARRAFFTSPLFLRPRRAWEALGELAESLVRRFARPRPGRPSARPARLSLWALEERAHPGETAGSLAPFAAAGVFAASSLASAETVAAAPPFVSHGPADTPALAVTSVDDGGTGGGR